MPFEAFLGDARKRPTGLTVFGYAVSLSLHGPPITLFAITWLTRALLVGGGLELAEPRAEVVYYQVPVQLSSIFPGMGQGAGPVGGISSAGGNGRDRRGSVGRSKRRARRPLVAPSRTALVTVRAQPVALAVGDDGDDDAGVGGLGGHGDGNGLGHGDGMGLGRGGPGGEGNGPGGLAMAAARERSAGKSKKADKPAAEEGDEEGDFGDDDESYVGTPLVGRPARISMDHAAYLRTYEVFPSPLPDSCWPPGRVANSMLVEVCVTERGDVSDVVIRQSAGSDADTFLSSAIRSWRYRPRLVMGSPRPFCHPIRIVYKRDIPFNRRW
jgi:hypothetical protein